MSKKPKLEDSVNKACTEQKQQRTQTTKDIRIGESVFPSARRDTKSEERVFPSTSRDVRTEGSVLSSTSRDEGSVLSSTSGDVRIEGSVLSSTTQEHVSDSTLPLAVQDSQNLPVLSKDKQSEEHLPVTRHRKRRRSTTSLEQSGEPLMRRTTETEDDTLVTVQREGRQLASTSQEVFDEHQTQHLIQEGGTPSVTVSTSQHYFAAPVTQYDLSNASNVTLSVGENGIRGCITNETLDARIQLLKNVFVEVKALKKVSQLLKRFGHVTISGAPGDGKTSIALMLCETYRKRNFQTLFVENIEDLDTDVITKLNTNLFIVFDDIFGCVTFSCSLEKVQKMFRALTDVMLKIKRTQEMSGEKSRKDQESSHPGHKLYVVFTSRTYNLHEGLSKLFVYKSSLFRRGTILDLTSEGLTTVEKVDIISSFTQWSKGCDISDKDINDISELQNELFGFPFICKLYFTTPAFQIHTVKFFKHPLTYLRGELDLIVWECSNRSAAIILLTLCGGKLDLVSFHMKKEMGQQSEKMFQAVKEIVPSCTRTDVRKELNNFNGTYCKVEQQTASFSHPSIYDAAACALGKLNIMLLLEYCTLSFMFERVRVNKSSTIRPPEPDDVTNMIYIDESLYPLVVSRLVEGIRQGHFSMTVNHPVLSDDHFASLMIGELNDILANVIEQRDKDTEKSFLYWTALTDSKTLFEKSLEHVKGKLQKTSEHTSLSSDLSENIMDDISDALVTCVQSGNVDYLKTLITLLCDHGKFDTEIRTKENETLLMIAAENDHLDVFNVLLQKGAKVSSLGKDGKNCLHCASESGSLKITKVITDKFPDMINICDDYGQTPAMLCALWDHVKLLEVLVSRGADLTIKNKWNSNCLHIASYEGNLSTAKMMLSQKKFDLDIDEKDKHEWQSSVLMAAEQGHYDLFNLLVSNGATLSLTDEDENDCLMLACKGGNVAIVRHLLSLKIFDINKKVGESSRSPVMISVEEGHYDVYTLLLTEGADLSLTDKYNTNCLTLACQGGNVSIVKHLLSLKIFDINRKDDLLEQTPVMVAASKGHLDVFDILVSEGADLSLTDSEDLDCLMLACNGGNVFIVRHLLSLNTFNINRKGGDRKETPVMLVVEEGHYGIYKLLVQQGADLSLMNQNNMDCLMLACTGGNLSIVEHLMSLKMYDINRKGGYFSQTPVMMAAYEGHFDVYKLLVSLGADLSLTDKHNTDCLMLACDGGHASIVKHLLSLKTFDINRRGGFDNKTIVMVAAELGYSEIFHYLILEEADLSVTTDDNKDCLMLACEGGHMSIVKHLLSLKTFDINKRSGPDNQTPVMAVAARGFDDIFRVLASRGADISLTDIHDNDCLMLASKGGQLSTVKHLLSLKMFDINKRDGLLDQTPVMMAAEGGHFGVYDLLVAEGADLFLTDKENRNCLMLACEGQNISIIKHLLSLKTFNVNRRGGTHNQTPLMAAARHGFNMYDVCKLLVSEGADLSLTDEDNNDCLMLGCEGGDVDVVKYLLSLKAFDVNRRGGCDNKTPIMVAVDSWGHSDIYDLLVAEGADIPVADDDSSDNESQSDSDIQSQNNSDSQSQNSNDSC